MCKKTLGTSGGGLVHTTWIELGPDAARKLINNTQFTVNHWLLHVRAARARYPGAGVAEWGGLEGWHPGLSGRGTRTARWLRSPLTAWLPPPSRPPPTHTYAHPHPQNGMSIGIGDTVADDATMATVNGILEAAKLRVQGVIEAFQSGQLEGQPGRTMMEAFEAKWVAGGGEGWEGDRCAMAWGRGESAAA